MPTPCSTDGKPGAIYHREHASHAGVFFADQKRGRAATVAEDHGAGWRAMNAQFVLDRVRAHIIARAKRSVCLDQKLRNEKQRNAARTGRRIGQSREHKMNDVLGEIVLAESDEDFLALDAVGTVAGTVSARAQRAHIRAGLRLGELHRAHPFAGNELFQVNALKRVAAMGIERVNGGHRQHRPVGEADRGRMPHFRTGGIDDLWQALAAPFERRGDGIPAGQTPGAVRLLPTGGSGDHAVFEWCAVSVADAIKRSDDFCGKAPGFRYDRLNILLTPSSPNKPCSIAGNSGAAYLSAEPMSASGAR